MQQNNKKEEKTAAAVSREGEYVEKYLRLNEVNRMKVQFLVNELQQKEKVS